MTTPTTEAEELTAARCIECKVAVVRIEGTRLSRGKMPNWKHNWDAYPTIQSRPSCKLSAGPLYDDQVEGIPEGEGGIEYPGDDDADD